MRPARCASRFLDAVLQDALLAAVVLVGQELAGHGDLDAAAFRASGLTSFICPSSAPTTSTGDMPPISSVICFQVQPFSRLMSRIFSVSSSRLIGTPPWLAAWVKTKRLAGLRAVERSSGSRRGTPSLTSLRRGDAGAR